jgi:hypothetical protein
MIMVDITGVLGGERVAEQDAQSKALFAQQLQDNNISLQQHGITLETSKIALESQQKMMQLMQDSVKGKGGANGPGKVDTEALPNALDQMAAMAAASGLPGQAADYAGKASTLRKNQQAIQHQQLTDAIKHLTIAADLTANVHDQESFDRANSEYEMATGEPSPFAGQKYSPELLENIHNSVTTGKDKALTAAAEARQQASLAEVREREARIPLLKAQTDLTESRDNAIRKNGGKIPKSEDLRAVTDLITKDYAGAYLPEDARVLARPIAERAAELVQKQGLSKSVAANRAYQEAKAAGTFGGARPRAPGTGTFNKPIPIPMDGNKVDKSKMKSNLWYDVGGKPMLLVGGKLYSQQELDAAGNESEKADDEEVDQ